MAKEIKKTGSKHTKTTVKKTVDHVFLWLVIILMSGGFFVFLSASLGLLAREETNFGSVVVKQAITVFILGTAALYAFSRIPYEFWERHALKVFALSTIATALVFVPGIGFRHGGATRWLDVGFTTLQPAEFLKFGVIVMLAAFYAKHKGNIQTWTYGTLPLVGTLAITGALMLAQPDTGTYLAILASACSIFIIAGGKKKHIALLVLLGVVAVGVLAYTRPYVRDRIETFLNPTEDIHGSAWQIRQSLYAVGSGGMMGKGFGQSVQKFGFLPEPIGDSIFSVAAEEFGFLGATLIILTFIIFLFRALTLAARAPDTFSGLVVSGIAILIVFQAFLNIGALLGVVPLTGLPLTFVSHGGTAILFALAEAGVILQISRYARKH